MEFLPLFGAIIGASVGAFFSTKALIKQDKQEAIAEERRLAKIEQSIALLSHDLEGFMSSIRLHLRGSERPPRED